MKMKSKSGITGGGFIYLGIMAVFIIASGVLVKFIVAALIIHCVVVTFGSYTPRSKDYSKTDKKGKTNLPPALAEKLARRNAD